jgi:4-hydroxymandelate oxidase
MPVLIAPTGLQAMAHKDGETATAQAARNKGTVMTLSTLSNYSLEEVAAAAGSEAMLWFQLYVHKERATTKDLVQRAEAAGYKALVLTVDLPVNGVRERDERNNLALPPGLTFKNLMPYATRSSSKDMTELELANYINRLHDPTLTWKDIEWLRSITKLPVVIKGVMHPDDALLAYKHGASAIVVSNHGGRQLDTSPATIDVLPEIVSAVDGKIDILIDGGVRRGSDVIKALAYGAKAVLLGRPILWGLSVAGKEGVEFVLDMFQKDIDLNMALCGCTKISDITADLLWERK